MLDLRFVRKNIELVKDALKKRGLELDINVFLNLDEKRRVILKEVEVLKAKRNQLSAEISKAKRAGKDINELLTEVKTLSQKIDTLHDELE